MPIEFELTKEPAYRIAFVAWSGPWSDAKIRRQFESVAKWAKANRLRTGAWVFREPGDRRWETGIQVFGKARAGGGVRLKTLPASRVARIVFDPQVLSTGVAWHGLNDWVKWRKREKKIRAVRSYREVYRGNPWTDRKAWSRTEMQLVVA
jgi:DNA gyrase inhibitor GyrI